MVAVSRIIFWAHFITLLCNQASFNMAAILLLSNMPSFLTQRFAELKIVITLLVDLVERNMYNMYL